MAVQIAITTLPTSATYKLIKVISRGRVYAITAAEPFPSEEDVRELWRTERRAFRPYNETTGRYLAHTQRSPRRRRAPHTQRGVVTMDGKHAATYRRALAQLQGAARDLQWLGREVHSAFGKLEDEVRDLLVGLADIKEALDAHVTSHRQGL